MNKANPLTLATLARVLLRHFSLVLLVPTAFAGQPTGVTLRGFLDLQFFSAPGRRVLSMCSSNAFTASICTDGRYAFEVRPIYQTNNLMAGKEEAFYMTYNGTDTFFCHYTEAVQGFKEGRPAIVGTKPIEEAGQMAYVSAGAYPFAPYDPQSRCQFLWLAFGAGAYLRTAHTNDVPLPWIPARWNLLAFGFRWDCTAAERAPYTPSLIKFVRDTSLDLREPADEFRRPELVAPNADSWYKEWKGQLQDRLSRWEQGLLAGRFEAESFTNVNGLATPQSFTLKVFRPKSRSEDNVRRFYSAAATAVASLDPREPFLPPILGKKLWVDDSRFAYSDKKRKVDEIYYSLAPNASWKSRDDPELQARFASARYSARSVLRSRNHDRNVRLIAVAALFLFSAAPLVAYVLMRKQAGRMPADKVQTNGRN